MEAPNLNPPTSPPQQAGGAHFNIAHFVKSVLIFLVFIMCGFIVLVGRAWYQGNQAKEEIETRERHAAEAQQRYANAMAQDAYGAQTPQATLRMFIEALNAGDVELASKYFVLDENLSHEQWRQGLTEKKDSGELAGIVTMLEHAIPDAQAVRSDTSYTFKALDVSGDFDIYVDMQWNEHAKVWKIESVRYRR